MTATRDCWCDEIEGRRMAFPGFDAPKLPDGRCRRCAAMCLTSQCPNFAEPANDGYCRGCRP